MHNLRRWPLSIAMAGLAAAGPADAQTGISPSAPAAMVETDPVRCWWKSTAASVHVGERFELTLTCSVVEAPDVRVVVDESRLDPGAVQLIPFDVVEGVRHPDVLAGYRRLFQYEYSLRIIGTDVFNRDIAIPPLDLRYRIQTDGAQSATLDSMERAYRLPTLPIHVATLVPPQADDIRDAPADTFDGIQRRRFRGNVAFSASALLFTGAVGMFAFAAAGLIRRYRGPRQQSSRLLSEGAVLRGVLNQLRQVEQEVLRYGWNDALSGRALAAIRLATTVALRRPAPQAELTGSVDDGALRLARGIVRPKYFQVSSSVTTELGGSRGETTESSPVADDLRAILADFTAARYGRSGCTGRDLDGVLRQAIELTQRLRGARPWPSRVTDIAGDAVDKMRLRFDPR
jgi:hypothetical protein